MSRKTQSVPARDGGKRNGFGLTEGTRTIAKVNDDLKPSGDARGSKANNKDT